MNRRTVLGAGLAAIPVGVGAGLGIRWWMTAGATIRLLGQKASMIALFDTGNERVVFLLGEPDIEVLNSVPQLLTFGRRRVDMVIGSHRWLTTEGVRNQFDLYDIATISIQSSASAPPIRGNVHTVTSNQFLQLGEQSEIMLRPSRDIIPDGNGTDPDVAVDIWCQGARLMLANRTTALTAVETGSHLLAVPGEVPAEIIAQHRPEIFVGTSLPADIDVQEIQAFPNEPLSFSIRDGSVNVRRNQLLS